MINFQDLRWVSTSLLHSRAYQYSTAKAYVFSDTVPCLGKMGENLVESWKREIQWYSDNNYFKELNRIDGQPMEFEWKIFPGLTTLGILNQIHQMMGELQCEPENFTGRIIFRSMFNDIVWDAKGNDESCENNSKTIEQYARRFPRGHWSFQGPGSERSGTELTIENPDGSWDRTADKMLLNFAGTGHPGIPWDQCLGERRIKKQRKWKDVNTLQWQGTINIELLLQMVISVNQLSIYGAVADMIEELPVGQRYVEKPKAPDQLDKVEILTQLPLAETQANEERQGNLLQEYEQRFEKLSRRPEVIQTMLRSRFEISRKWTIIPCSSVTERKRKSIFMPRIYDASRSRRNSYQRVESKAMYNLALSRT